MRKPKPFIQKPREKLPQFVYDVYLSDKIYRTYSTFDKANACLYRECDPNPLNEQLGNYIKKRQVKFCNSPRLARVITRFQADETSFSKEQLKDLIVAAATKMPNIEVTPEAPIENWKNAHLLGIK